MVYKHPPLFDKIRVFGCLYFVTKLNNNDKFSKRFENFVLIGYSNIKKGYIVCTLDNGVSFFYRNVKFDESIFSLKLAANSDGIFEFLESYYVNNIDH